MIWINGAVVIIAAGLLLILTADVTTKESDGNRANPPEDENP